MLRRCTLQELEIIDETAFEGIAVYPRLKRVLIDAAAQYVVMPAAAGDRWDHTLLLNLTFWQPGQQDDVLQRPEVPADVVAPRACPHLAHAALGGAATTAPGLLMGEAIASAFDAYLVGMLLQHAPDAAMLETQVPAMVDVAAGAGLDEPAIDALLQRLARAPEVAFEQLRELLFDVGMGLWRARGVEDAAAVLLGCDAHPLSALLHHYELSSWLSYARARASDADCSAVDELDAALRRAPDALAWLSERWLAGHR